MPQDRDIQQKERAGEKRDPNRDWTKTYDESDLKHVLKVSNAHDWNDAIKYLDERGMNDNELTPGETISMKEDLQRAARGGSKFIQDPAQAYKHVRRVGAPQAKGAAGHKSQSKKR